MMVEKVNPVEQHKLWQGKIETRVRADVKNEDVLKVAYTPGVAEPCLEIQKDVAKSYDLTRRWNTVAVVTDGTAVLGLGDIGPEAGMPVMEGKCALFKAFGDVDAIPLCIKSKDVDTIVETVKLISGSFAGVNLEDISAPRCFEIEERLKKETDIIIFHDDQHGTAIVVAAALINAAKLTGRKVENIKAVINGAGAAGIAIAKLLLKLGVKDILLCDSKGIICKGDDNLNEVKKEMAEITNKDHKKGGLKEALEGADCFIGVSKANLVSPEMVKSMNQAIIFACANPVPEIMPELAIEAGASVVGTGRSDFPNQINNVLVFPGIFRGALDARAKEINDEMKIAAAYALADLVGDDELSSNYILPKVFDDRVAKVVAKAVYDKAMETGVARV